MADVGLVVLGSVLATLTAACNEWLRRRFDTRAESRRQAREASATYMPEVLDLLAALRWLLADLERAQTSSAWGDNPFPKPPAEVRVPGTWYRDVLRMSHHPSLSDKTQGAAREVRDGIEKWNAVVEDHETAEAVASSILESTEKLVAALEAEGGTS